MRVHGKVGQSPCPQSSIGVGKADQGWGQLEGGAGIAGHSGSHRDRSSGRY